MLPLETRSEVVTWNAANIMDLGYHGTVVVIIDSWQGFADITLLALKVSEHVCLSEAKLPDLKKQKTGLR